MLNVDYERDFSQTEDTASQNLRTRPQARYTLRNKHVIKSSSCCRYLVIRHRHTKKIHITRCGMSGGASSMVGNEQQRTREPQRLLDCIRDFIKQGGPQARADVRFYLRMCLKAEELRQQGWHATVRGERQRWLVVIDGSQSSEKSLSSTPRARLHKFNSRRNGSFIFCRK